MIQARGRMITTDISKSKKVASLSDKAFKVFTLIIPHLSAHGKLLGNPEYIKGLCCPLFDDLTVLVIKKCLKEIGEKTNLKWFCVDSIFYIHSLNHNLHQPKLNQTKMGEDRLPDYSKTTPREVAHEVEVDIEVEGEVEVETEVDNYVAGATGFDEFWKAYPKKVGKEAARKAWQKLKTPDTLLPRMIETLTAWANCPDWTKENRKYCPHPSKWLNDGRWDDDPPTKPKMSVDEMCRLDEERRAKLYAIPRS